MQQLRAVGEQRRAALAEIQPPRIHFRKMRDELRRRLSFVRGQSLHVLDQLDIGQRRGHIEKVGLHTPFYHRHLVTLVEARGEANSEHGTSRHGSCRFT